MYGIQKVFNTILNAMNGKKEMEEEADEEEDVNQKQTQEYD